MIVFAAMFSCATRHDIQLIEGYRGLHLWSGHNNRDNETNKLTKNKTKQTNQEVLYLIDLSKTNFPHISFML